MKKNKFLAPIIIFMIGVSICLYPTIANRIAIYLQTREIKIYNATLDDYSKEKIKYEFDRAEIYNENLAGDPVHDPFIPGTGYTLPDNYVEVLNVNGDGVMGYIEIPKIDINIPIYHGTSDKVLGKGVGHIEGTSLPIGGQYRHSVLCGHRGLPSAKLFTDLDQLETGDEFFIHILNKTLAYKVDQIETVLPENINQYFQSSPAQDLVTLMTCTPYGINTHRLLVRGHRVKYVEERVDEISYEEDTEKYFIYSLIILGFLLFLIFVLLVKKKHNKRKG